MLTHQQYAGFLKWREKYAFDESKHPRDDEELAEFPPDVVAMLGFDPRKYTDE